MMTHKRPSSSSRKRLSKVSTAAEALAEFSHGVEVDCLTFGQFSIIDAIEAVLAKTGPARVTLATWTAAEFDLSQIQAQILTANILDFQMIIDRSFVTRHPRFVQTIIDKFGADSVRTTNTHAKFILIENAGWSVVIRTSMNLNHNPRLEYLQVADDAELLAFYRHVCDAIFDEEPEGLGKTRGMPALAGVSDVPRQHAISFGKQPRMGP